VFHVAGDPVTTGSSVAKSTAHGWTMFVAAGDMMTARARTMAA